MSLLDVTAYEDYRVFLRDFVFSKRGKDESFSVLKLAEQIGVSHSLLKMVLSGKRSLNDDILLKIADLVNLSYEQKIYFEALVRENDAASAEIARFHKRRRLDAKTKVKTFHRPVRKSVSLDASYFPAVLLYLIDVEGLGEKSLTEINRVQIKKVFSLKDSELDRLISTFQKENLLSVAADGKIQFTLDKVGTKIKRQEFLLKVFEEGRRRCQSDLGKKHTYFSADTLSISEDEIDNFYEDYKRLIAEYISKDTIPGKTRILQSAFQGFVF